MNTIFSLIIMFASFTVGLIFVAIMMLLMGLFGAPGAILFDLGRKAQNGFLSITGLIVTAIGQSYVVCAYTVLVISVLRTFAEAKPHIPTWPLWIAAFFHSGAVPTYAMKERPDVPTSQHLTLGLVATAAVICFLVMIFSPELLSGLFGWVPFFQSNIKG